jgi:hypothetical protein
MSANETASSTSNEEPKTDEGVAIPLSDKEIQYYQAILDGNREIKGTGLLQVMKSGSGFLVHGFGAGASVARSAELMAVEKEFEIRSKLRMKITVD